MLYGKDWKSMQPLIKTRTNLQIRTHAQKMFKKVGLKKVNKNMSLQAQFNMRNAELGLDSIDDRVTVVWLLRLVLSPLLSFDSSLNFLRRTTMVETSKAPTKTRAILH